MVLLRCRVKVWSSLVVPGECFAEGIVFRAWISPGWKLKILDWATTVLVHCSLLGGVTFGDLLCFLGVVLGVICVLLFRGVDLYGGTFLFSFLFIFSFGCVHPGCRCDILLVQRLGVTSIFMILIYSPFQKKCPWLLSSAQFYPTQQTSLTFPLLYSAHIQNAQKGALPSSQTSWSLPSSDTNAWPPGPTCQCLVYWKKKGVPYTIAHGSLTLEAPLNMHYTSHLSCVGVCA